MFGYYDEKFCNSLHTLKINSKTSEEEGTCMMYVTKEFYLHRKIYTEIFLVIGKLKIQVSSSFKICWFNCWHQYYHLYLEIAMEKKSNKYFNCEICEKRFSSDRYKAQHVSIVHGGKKQFQKEFSIVILVENP